MGTQVDSVLGWLVHDPHADHTDQTQRDDEDTAHEQQDHAASPQGVLTCLQSVC
jgi:hypothetical protein